MNFRTSLVSTLVTLILAMPAGIAIGVRSVDPEVRTVTKIQQFPPLAKLGPGDDTEIEKRLGPPLAEQRPVQIGPLPELPVDIYSTVDDADASIKPGDTLIFVATIPTVPERPPVNAPKPSKQEAL